MTETEHRHQECQRATLYPKEYIKICACGDWQYVFEYPEGMAAEYDHWKEGKGTDITKLMRQITRRHMSYEEENRVRRYNKNYTRSQHTHNIIMYCHNFYRNYVETKAR